MTQITSGLRSVLSLPAAYGVFQDLLGAQRGRAAFVDTYVKPSPGDRVLDVGCGPAAILDHLPGVEYHGYDINRSYIDAARSRYGDRGRFSAEIVTDDIVATLPKFDLVLAIGLLHHLDDDEATSLLGTCRKALKDSGRFVSFDGCFTTEQSALARFIISRDRGCNVRDEVGYTGLAASVFGSVSAQIRHDLLRVPYTHIILDCSL